MKLLQVPTVALEQRIKEELQINPALEEGSDDEEINNDETQEDDNFNEDSQGDSTETDTANDFNIEEYIQDEDLPYYKLNTSNTGPDDERTEIPVVLGNTFQDVLFSQLGMCDFDEQTYKIAEHIIGSIDDHGYLRRPLKAIVDDLAFSQYLTTTEEDLQNILLIIQTFDPPGVGARDLQECLLLQLKRKDANDPFIALAIRVVKDYMDEFSKKHYDKIAKHLDISEESLKDVIHEILKLNPKPGDSYSDTQKSDQHVVPDFIMTNNDGVLELTLNSKNAPDLRVSKSYLEMMESYPKEKHKKSTREAIMFVKQKLDAAKWFIDAIKQRQHTLLKTMSAIMNYQYEYFLEGDETKLRPMILKDIAEQIGLDISTISRVANSKYVQTQFGTFLLKSFFSEALQTESGEEVSSREVKKILSDCIEVESKKKPLTDDALAKILKQKGYTIARRTIAKYREQLNIPVARLRKEL